MKLFKYLSITSLIILTLYSCTKHEGASIEGTTLNITLSGVESDYENLEPSLKSANLEVNNKENSPVFQTQVIPFSNDIVLRMTLEEVGSANNTAKLNASVNKNAAIDRTSLESNVRYTVLVYQNDILVAEKNYVYGNEGMVEPFALNSNIEYTFIAVSKNSASTLPVISDKNNLTTAQINAENGNLMFFKVTKTLNVGANNLSIILKHKFSQITTKISVGPTFLGSIKSISNATFTGAVASGSLKLSDETLTYSTTQTVKPVTFPTISGTTPILLSTPTLLISPAITNAKLNIGSLKVNDVTNPVEITGLKVNPGKKYNLNLTFDSPCIVDVGAANFNLANGGSQSFNAPAADYGFVFNITELDNSFNLQINNQPLIQQRQTIQTRSRTRTRNSIFNQFGNWSSFSNWTTSSQTQWNATELEFETVSGGRRQNVQYEDGTEYGNNSPNIWSIIGTTQNPALKVVVEKNGGVTLFGSKSSQGTLFPLKMRPPYTTAVTTTTTGGGFFDLSEVQTETRTLIEDRINTSISWNTTTTNTVIASQSVQGTTYMKGNGAGKKKIVCTN